jgi:hypothetical protein
MFSVGRPIEPIFRRPGSDDRDPVALLELFLLVDGERGGARRHEAERRHVGLRHRRRSREQHVDDGRDADRDGHAVVAHPVEEAGL